LRSKEARYVMRKTDDYTTFVNRTFEQITDLETESNKHPIRYALRDYGLTMAEATRLYYRRGMSGKQFLDAIKADREK
jgi:hypothetical protein